MTEAPEDLVRLAQEGQQYKALAAELADMLERVVRQYRNVRAAEQYPVDSNSCLLADDLLTKYRESLK